MGATGPHFTDAELQCPHCKVNGMKQEAVDLFEDVRAKAEEYFGGGRVRMLPDSAYRCEEHNAAVGGAPRSQHMQGLALDFRMQVGQDRGKGKIEWVPVQPKTVEEIARKSQKLGGIGRDDERGFVHIDARPRTTALPACWCYSGGKEVAYYKAGVQSTEGAA